MTPEDVRILSEKIDGLAVVVGRMGVQIDTLVEPGHAALCAVHEHRANETDKDLEKMDKRIAGIEAVQGKRHLLVLLLGAVGYGIGIAIKSFFFKGTP